MLVKNYMSTPLLILAALAKVVFAEPDHFCKSFGHGSNNDFCVSLATYDDPTFSKQDFIITFNRTQHAATGWSSVGIGNQMNGSIIFLLYGDPNSISPPTLSTNTRVGIHIGYVEAQWSASSHEGSKTATASFVCYGCNAWFYADRSAITPVLPFIWAANTEQDLSVSDYASDANLIMHNHYGSFDMDMTKEMSIVPKLLPDTISNFLRPSPPAAPNSPNNDNPTIFVPDKHRIWLLHGLCLAAAFFVLLPLGTIFIRTGSPHAFYLHLGLQIIGSISALVGMIVGFFLSTSVHTWHQYIGLGLGLAMLAQLRLGFQRHRVFVSKKVNTWMGNTHIWIGRCILFGGSVNVVLGLTLSDYTIHLKTGFTIAGVMNALVLGFVIYRHKIGKPIGKNLRIPWLSKVNGIGWADGANLQSYFALTDEDNNEGEEERRNEVEMEKGIERRQSMSESLRTEALEVTNIGATLNITIALLRAVRNVASTCTPRAIAQKELFPVPFPDSAMQTRQQHRHISDSLLAYPQAVTEEVQDDNPAASSKITVHDANYTPYTSHDLTMPITPEKFDEEPHAWDESYELNSEEEKY
ncbi:uncharacterized protein LY89DRAFT_729819 [Mollisia scopiformis]|uniref:Cytochrome b561 domain-containing protein n=1 Tax=Mollisia scopiformis TaxID=149040 RepID=A0A194XML8_MOLSC|nr:uncharacterized protein LY89DRAFT_729819 [Mollisia scopiformis]KUJ21017.1 hypothetical protein LY89DRAFT_729819 [Mollisia scopiformis]